MDSEQDNQVCAGSKIEPVVHRKLKDSPTSHAHDFLNRTAEPEAVRRKAARVPPQWEMVSKCTIPPESHSRKIVFKDERAM